MNPDLTNLGPDEITHNNVQYWCHHTKELKQTQVSKALKFVEYDCLRYVGGKGEYGEKNSFICLPLNTEDSVAHALQVHRKIPFPKDYNSNVYELIKGQKGQWECNCQGWQTQAKLGKLNKDGVNCAHVLALFYCFKMKRFGKPHGATEEQGKIDLE